MENQTKNAPQIVEVENVHGYTDAQGTVWLNAEDVARGLGFVMVRKERVTTSGDNFPKSGDTPYTAVRWERINGYISEFSSSPQMGNFSQEVGNFPHTVGKGDYIPEQLFYLLAMKASNEAAKNFQFKVAFKILPSIRKYGYYSLTNETAPAAKPAAKEHDLARVYLLRLSDGTVLIVKIGHSKNIRARVAKIKRETGLHVVGMYFTPEMPRKDARLVEWATQEQLSSRRVKGEFFSVDFDEARNVVDYFVEITLAALPNQPANLIADS